MVDGMLLSDVQVIDTRQVITEAVFSVCIGDLTAETSGSDKPQSITCGLATTYVINPTQGMRNCKNLVGSSRSVETISKPASTPSSTSETTPNTTRPSRLSKTIGAKICLCLLMFKKHVCLLCPDGQQPLRLT